MKPKWSYAFLFYTGQLSSDRLSATLFGTLETSTL